MTHKVDYELTKDKRGRKIAYKVDVATGKKKRIGYKVAQKRQRDLKYRRKRQAEDNRIKGEIIETEMEGVTVKEYRKIIEIISEMGTGGNFKDYAKAYKTADAKFRKGYADKEKKLPSESVIKSRVKKNVLEHRTGVACRYRYGWLYWLKVGTDKEGNPIADSTPVFEAGSLDRNINIEGVNWAAPDRENTDYETMIEICEDVHKPIFAGVKSGDIMNTEPYKVDGGCCVLLYDKRTKDTIKNSPYHGQYEKGKGCHYHFDFKGYAKR
jgi:hypothetical protein